MPMKTCVITGGKSGIGKATAIELAQQDLELIIFGRESQKTDDAIQEIITKSGNNRVSQVKVDLSEIESIKTACKQVNSDYTSIDYLINNAGLLNRKPFFNSQGVEHTLAVNYLAPFLISRLLLKKLQNSENGRLINVSSAMYKRGKLPITLASAGEKYNGNQAYSDSKLLVLLDAIHLARDPENSNISINSMHPGVVGTDVFREYPKWFASLLNMMITKPEKAGVSLASLVTNSNLFPESGLYYNINKPERVKDLEHLLSQYQQLMSETEKFVDL